MQPDDEVRIRHLVDAASSAARFVEGRPRADLDEGELLGPALTKLVDIVGEAAKQVSPDGRAELPGVPRSAAARTQYRLVHHYVDIDADVLRQTVTEDLPALLHESG
ncbi:MAG: DUF86 domain-containing protein [Acidimicrobiales bacterium]|nr:DUF86 domain-containing protein [Acidimicrobiales bacterium]